AAGRRRSRPRGQRRRYAARPTAATEKGGADTQAARAFTSGQTRARTAAREARGPKASARAASTLEGWARQAQDRRRGTAARAGARLRDCHDRAARRRRAAAASELHSDRRRDVD